MQIVVLEAVMNSSLKSCGAEVNAWEKPRDWHLADLETPAEAEETTRIGELPPIMEGQVVVCDDLRDMRGMMCKGLEQKGFVVHTAENGKARS